MALLVESRGANCEENQQPKKLMGKRYEEAFHKRQHTKNFT